MDHSHSVINTLLVCAESGYVIENQEQGCPGCSVVKNPPASAGDIRSIRDPGIVCHGATKPVAATAEPARWGWEAPPLSPRAQLLRRVRPTACALQARPRQGESHAPQLESTGRQQGRPSIATNK